MVQIIGDSGFISEIDWLVYETKLCAIHRCFHLEVILINISYVFIFSLTTLMWNIQSIVRGLHLVEKTTYDVAIICLLFIIRCNATMTYCFRYLIFFLFLHLFVSSQEYKSRAKTSYRNWGMILFCPASKCRHGQLSDTVGWGRFDLKTKRNRVYQWTEHDR